MSIFDGREDYDSKEELFFSWFIDELIKAGYISSYKYHPKPFLLSEKANYSYLKVLKTKSNDVSGFLLNPHSYQADFLINWTKKAHYIFYVELNERKNISLFPFIAHTDFGTAWSVVDIKGTFSGPHNNSAISFPLDQKWVYQKYKIYVQKIIPAPAVDKTGKVKNPSAIFYRTFTPKQYLLTDVSKKARKIKYTVRTLEEYIKSFNSII